ncbi:uncharacterized protein LOC111267683 [Varroa jacobsoni]|uniref:uncharacterized protein LOC111267683 n=1 Tax=Varroa jacobsoni TaxID=62625 RepID=UPI000BF3A852|nr:uncharacterized protein LOC111267683 [Varroa jacobsoni]
MGKKTVLCVGAQLTEVPQKLHKDTQVLDLSGNILQTFESREFQRLGYTNLQRLFASRCGLVHLADESLQLLHNLVNLDLSANFLTRVPTRALSDCLALRKLSLNNNPIEVLHDDAFLGLGRLGTLVLTSCQLKTIDPHAFRGLRLLEFLRLSHNFLTKVPPEAFAQHLSTQHLHGVDLEENPWMCDCKMRQVRQWMSNNNIPLPLPPKCAQPSRLQGISWQALDFDDFACPPELAAMDASVTASEGDNATLRCEIDSQSPADIRWSIRGRQIRNMTMMSFGNQMYVVQEKYISAVGFNFKSSVLTIVNVMPKDGGPYSCEAINRAGNVSASMTLIVHPRAEASVVLIASVEIGGVVIGVLLTIVVLVGSVCLVMQQYSQYCEERDALEAAIPGKKQNGMTTLPDTGTDRAGQRFAAETNDAFYKSSNRAQSPPSSNMKEKPCYETIVTVQKNNTIDWTTIPTSVLTEPTIKTGIGTVASIVLSSAGCQQSPEVSTESVPPTIRSGAASSLAPARLCYHTNVETPINPEDGGHNRSTDGNCSTSYSSLISHSNYATCKTATSLTGVTSHVGTPLTSTELLTTIGSSICSASHYSHHHIDMLLPNPENFSHSTPVHYHDKDGTIHIYQSGLEGNRQLTGNVVLTNLLHQSALAYVAASSSEEPIEDGAGGEKKTFDRTTTASRLVKAIVSELEERIADRITEHLRKTAVATNENLNESSAVPLPAAKACHSNISSSTTYNCDNTSGTAIDVAYLGQSRTYHAARGETQPHAFSLVPAVGNSLERYRVGSSTGKSSITACNVSTSLVQGSVPPRSVAERAIEIAGPRRGNVNFEALLRQRASRDSPDEGLGDEVREDDSHRNKDMHGAPYC